MKRWVVAFVVSCGLIIGVQYSVSSLLTAIDRGNLKGTLADARSVATALEAYRSDHGKYPAAFGYDELESFLDPDYIKILPGHIDYLSDGSGYVAYIWNYRTDGPMPKAYAPIEVREGIVVSWPQELGLDPEPFSLLFSKNVNKP